MFTSINADSYTKNNFDDWLVKFRQHALNEGVSLEVFNKAFKGITPDPDVIELDQSQAEFTRNIWDYINNATSKSRIKKGKRLLQEHRSLLSDIEKRYGVQPEIIVAIWAMESDFGRNYGNKSVVRSLATLAFSSTSPKRIEFARKELLLTLKLLQSDNIPNNKLIGSWAGAMGQPQFMPSSYIKFGVDYNRDGRKDLWSTLPDVFASIANFLAGSGWRENEAWGEEVRLPHNFDWRLNAENHYLSYEDWSNLGVNKYDGKQYQFPTRQSALFIPAGKNGPVFLVNHNFSVIKRYNKSSSYALSVAQLSNLFGLGDKIRASWPISDKALSVEDVKRIQTLLNKKGHNVGTVDGKIGSKTREAIRTWQIENGFSGDGYANLSLLYNLQL